MIDSSDGRKPTDGNPVVTQWLIGELRRLKAGAGLGYVALAERTNFSKSALQRYLDGSRLPPRQAVQAISDACGGDTGQLVALWDLVCDSATSQLPAMQPGCNLMPAQLSHDIPDFVGRAAEIDRLHRLQSDRAETPAIIVITGGVGVGKSALAVRFAHQVADRFDGQLFCDLGGFRLPHPPARPEQVLGRFLRALGVGNEQLPAEPDEQASLLRSKLAGKRVLMVLDNAATVEQVRPMLPGGPGCLVLVTSRSRLGGLVARNGARQIILDALSEDEAVALLAKSLDVELSEADRRSAVSVAHSCERLPLALRIAAGRIITRPHLTLAHLASQLAVEERRLDLLAADDDDTTSVRSAISSSYDALPPETARILCLLATRLGNMITVPAAARLICATVDQVRAHADVLANASLIRQINHDWYRLDDLLRIYATERISADYGRSAG